MSELSGQGVSHPSVVVVGSGIAGLTAALHALEAGCRVTVVTKGSLSESNTRYAQGGIAAVWTPTDSVDDHAHDTLVAGAGLNDETAVRTLVTEGPARVEELIARGVAFDRDADGTVSAGLEAAHSAARVLHAGGDATGAAIEAALVARIRESGAAIVAHALVVDLALDRGRVVGVVVLHGGERRTIAADAVVLATGGAGQLYAHTTNPTVATGDGVALALRAGAAVADLEFVQFHPTVLPGRAGFSADAAAPFLISEAVRGEGAVLRDMTGRRFAFDAHPDGELAPRDVVARAIDRAMATQGGAPVVLDATALGAEFLARRFPTIDRTVRERGYDWSREPIPVTPAAHYLMGGVVTDLDGRTTVPGLYAAGEVARTGVHGANRLASNSLLEGAVFGARVGDVVAADAASGGWPVPAALPASLLEPPITAPAEPFSRVALQRLLWAHAALTRTADGLGHAASVLAAWCAEPRAARTVADHEDAHLLLVAAHVVDAARRRPLSVGAHHRADGTTPDTLRPAAASHAPLQRVLEGTNA
ncbi:L-aspartate oxidase [Microbacterium hatanonis]|uniref:L-aspartate oxidase n=1 Tax=Microbacterium hatanonis TaxID=404366 RepID=UPI001FE6F7DC|nr:L-aspartate oxidase [Microbacterium hatanonis]